MTTHRRTPFRHKLIQSAGMTALIFAVTLGTWSIHRYQQSDASQVNNLSIAPTSGQAPLTVTAAYTGPITSPPVSRTVDFDSFLDGTVITDQYLESHGVKFDSESDRLVHTRVNNAGCPGSGTEASSAPNFLTGQLASTETIVVTFGAPTRSINFQLLSVGANTVETVFSDTAGNVLETIQTGGRIGDPTGACQKDLISYRGSDLVTQISIRVNQLVTNNDGFGIDDLTFTPFDGEGAGIVGWNFGDGSGWQYGARQTHTYQQAGTYSVDFLLGDAAHAGVATIVVSDSVELAVSPRAGTAPLAVTATHTNAKANQTRTWDFGDGTVLTNTETQVSHMYPQIGSYKVSLTVNGGTTSQMVTVTDPPTPSALTTLKTSQEIYSLGETDVRFSLTNHGPDPISLTNTAPWRIKYQGTAVFTPIGAEVIQEVLPTKAVEWTWNHKNDAGALVAPGAYSVEVDYRIGTGSGANLIKKEVAFTLQTPSAATPSPSPSATPSPIASQTTQATPGIFTAVPMSGRAPLLVQFTYTGTKPSLLVDFGDGSVIASASGPLDTTHVYTEAGRYTATLRSGSQILDKKVIDVSTASTDPRPLPTITDSASPAASASATAAATSASGVTKSTTVTGKAATSIPTGQVKQLVSTGVSLGTSIWIALILSTLATVVIMKRA